MGHGTKDELLPWVLGGVLLIAATIAVAAVAASTDTPPARYATQVMDKPAAD